MPADHHKSSDTQEPNAGAVTHETLGHSSNGGTRDPTHQDQHNTLLGADEARNRAEAMVRQVRLLCAIHKVEYNADNIVGLG
jgi:hypothetical protein